MPSEETLAILLGGVNAGLLAALVQASSGGSEGFGAALPTALFGVGLPTATAGLIVSYLENFHKFDIKTSLLIGGGSVGLMVLLGELPGDIDMQTVILILLIAAGSYSANWVAEQIAHKDKSS